MSIKEFLFLGRIETPIFSLSSQKNLMLGE
ncbi:MAG: hypothetical protein ThorAB25_27130 [Candidatus Thorarchaeota archaeon AB_25]|nr:MAG: hypothetical protein ThorAB25_27130 [Candidatus Thorarchaeota archaeon AB_25]